MRFCEGETPCEGNTPCEGTPLVKGIHLVKGDTLIERTTQTVIKSRSPQSGDMAFNKSFCEFGEAKL